MSTSGSSAYRTAAVRQSGLTRRRVDRLNDLFATPQQTLTDRLDGIEYLQGSTEQSLQHIHKSNPFYKPLQPKQSPKMADICIGKVPFSRPASQTPFSKLPAELNTKIFDLAFGLRSRDVASCRLASQNMLTLCSPYLIRTAVVARRDKARKKLIEVMRHPYFNKHVTHLLWDASEYDKETAESERCYNTAVLESPQLKRHLVTRFQGTLSNRDERAEYIRDREDCSRVSQWDALLRSGLGIHSPIYESRVAWLSLEKKLDTSGNILKYYGRGQTLGMKQYADCLRTQETLNSNRPAFRVAITAFKALEHVSFSDFRTLAYSEESYVELCQRLFGDMVCPKFSGSQNTDEFLRSLRCPQRGSWKSISIGHHPFLGNAFDRIRQGEARKWHHSIAHCRLDEILSAEVLRLSVFSDGWQDNSVAHAQWGFGMNMMSKLRELELNFDDMQAEEGLMDFDSYDRTINFDRAQYDSYHDEWKAGTHPHLLFWNLLAARRHDFENLEILTLRNFTFEQEAMCDFLVGLKKLHTVHLIDCLSLGTYDGFFTATQTTLSQSLHLVGIEVYGLRFLEFDSQAEPRPPFDPELRDQVRVKRSLDYDLATECGLLPEFYPFTVRDWPCERPELEESILGGRHNNITRKARAAPNQAAKEGWEEIPVQDL
jgi:hypothetical protein